jgi:RNA polymerase sigma-70 factor (ECF subfamily)
MQARLEVSRDLIFDRLTVDLKKFIARRVNNCADAEDVLQEALFKIHRSIDRLAPDSNLYAWVYRVTRNAIVDYYRRQPPTLSLETSSAVPYDFARESLSKDALGEIAACLRPMLDCLPEKYRDALVLTDLEGMTQAELAARLGLSLSGAKSRVQRAREQLKALLMECCELEFDCRGRVVDYECKKAYRC